MACLGCGKGFTKEVVIAIVITCIIRCVTDVTKEDYQAWLQVSIQRIALGLKRCQLLLQTTLQPARESISFGIPIPSPSPTHQSRPLPSLHNRPRAQGGNIRLLFGYLLQGFGEARLGLPLVLGYMCMSILAMMAGGLLAGWRRAVLAAVRFPSTAAATAAGNLAPVRAPQRPVPHATAGWLLSLDPRLLVSPLVPCALVACLHAPAAARRHAVANPAPGSASACTARRATVDRQLRNM